MLAQQASSMGSKDAYGLTALRKAYQVHGNEYDWGDSALQILLINGADPSSPDQMGTIALVYLAESWKD